MKPIRFLVWFFALLLAFLSIPFVLALGALKTHRGSGKGEE